MALALPPGPCARFHHPGLRSPQWALPARSLPLLFRSSAVGRNNKPVTSRLPTSIRAYRFKIIFSICIILGMCKIFSTIFKKKAFMSLARQQMNEWLQAAKGPLRFGVVAKSQIMTAGSRVRAKPHRRLAKCRANTGAGRGAVKSSHLRPIRRGVSTLCTYKVLIDRLFTLLGPLP